MFFRMSRPACTDGVIDLVRMPAYMAQEDLHFGKTYDFMICPHGKRREAGRIALRLGEGEGIYYYGHIGYHIDPPYRGHGWAELACRLTANLLRSEGMHSVVITCDPDNIASRRTCEKLGCRLERIVPVAAWLQRKYDISAEKCRYIWLLDESKED